MAHTKITAGRRAQPQSQGEGAQEGELAPLERVLLRHEHSRGTLILDGLAITAAEGASAETDIEITPRPSTARRIAAAERTTSVELDGRAEQLSSAVQWVGAGVDSALEGLRLWRAQHDAELVEARARFEAEAGVAVVPAGLPVGFAAPHDPLGEGLDRAQVQRVREMLESGTRSGGHHHRATRRVPLPATEGASESLVAAKLDLMSATPPGHDHVDTDLALQRRLERELMAKYGITDSDVAGASTAGDSNASSRQAAALKVQLGKYAAGLDSVLDELDR
jgi:hypothetical protein